MKLGVPTLPGPPAQPQNMENVVKDSDNIKQDLSIDVYGRKKADEYAAKQVRLRHRTASPLDSACLQFDAKSLLQMVNKLLLLNCHELF